MKNAIEISSTKIEEILSTELKKGSISNLLFGDNYIQFDFENQKLRLNSNDNGMLAALFAKLNNKINNLN